MDKYVTITKSNNPPSRAKTRALGFQRTKTKTELEHIMHVATTASTRGHDIWQSASTGHQVSEAGAKSVTYNAARLAKLRAQFPAGRRALPDTPTDTGASAESTGRNLQNTGTEAKEQEREVVEGARLADRLILPATRDSSHIELFDYQAKDNTWYATRVPPSLLKPSTVSIATTTTTSSPSSSLSSISPSDPSHTLANTGVNTHAPSNTIPLARRGIFEGCVLYLNGYMGPQASDHTLRRLITQHSGLLAPSPARMTTTHIVLSRTGALADGKRRREKQAGRNRVVYVTVDWVWACVRAGRRVDERKYAIDGLKGRGDRSAADFFTLSCAATTTTDTMVTDGTTAPGTTPSSTSPPRQVQ